MKEVLIKEYNNLKKLSIKPKEGSYIFNIHFVKGAFVEILGDKFAKFRVEFINQDNNEIIHKTEITNNMWTKTTIKYYVNFLIKAMYPLIVISEKLTKLISGGTKANQFSRDEFVAMAGIGKEEGMLNDRESKIIRNLFLFKSLDASTVMTPRVVVSALQKDLTVDEVLSAPKSSNFSRLPIYDQDLDSVVGFVLREDLLVAKNKGQGSRIISDFKREIVTVMAKTPLSKLMEVLLEQRQHIALVVGEFGDTKGVVTLEDVVETLLGIEILDEGDKVEDMQKLARQLWVKRAEKIGIYLEPPTQ